MKNGLVTRKCHTLITYNINNNSLEEFTFKIPSLTKGTIVPLHFSMPTKIIIIMIIIKKIIKRLEFPTQ